MRRETAGERQVLDQGGVGTDTPTVKVNEGPVVAPTVRHRRAQIARSQVAVSVSGVHARGVGAGRSNIATSSIEGILDGLAGLTPWVCRRPIPCSVRWRADRRSAARGGTVIGIFRRGSAGVVSIAALAMVTMALPAIGESGHPAVGDNGLPLSELGYHRLLGIDASCPRTSGRWEGRGSTSKPQRNIGMARVRPTSPRLMSGTGCLRQ